MNCARCRRPHPPEASWCGACGARLEGTEARNAERRQLTVLFCDVVDSSGLSERLDPEDLRELIRDYQQTAHEVVGRFAGHIAQFLGDGILVYFGYPTAHEDSACRAVGAGLALVEALGNRGGAQPLAVRVGIHTGVVVAGEIGPEQSGQVLALGSTPNVAARLQALASPGEVFVSDVTHRLTEPYFEFDAPREIKLKGFERAVSVLRVLHAHHGVGRFELSASRGLTAFSGREQELHLLQRYVDDLSRNVSSAVALVGDPGVGKSRLVHRLRETVAASAARWICVDCSAQAEASPFLPLSQALRQVLELPPSEPHTTAIDKLELAADARSMERFPAVPVWSGLLGLDLQGRYPRFSPPPAQLRTQTVDTLVETILSAAERDSIVLCIEDLQWADPSTLAVLQELICRMQGARLLLLLVARSTASSTIASLGARAITLDRLPQDCVRRLVTSLTGSRLPHDVISRIVDRADGVPLYAEELTREMMECRGAPESVVASIPTTLHDLLMSRLDRLGAGRPVAQHAAVIGKTFARSVLVATAELDPEVLQSGISRLIESGLVEQVEHGDAAEPSYAFRHNLIRDAAYQSMLKKARRASHARIARAVVADLPNVAESHPEWVADHYARGGEPALAVRYWQRAGERAIAHCANEEAVCHVERALAALATLPEGPSRDEQELPLQMMAGRAFTAARGYASPRVEGAYTRAFELCRALGAEAAPSDVVRFLDSRLECANNLFETTGQSESFASSRLFWVFWGFGAFHQSRAELQQSIECAEHLLRLSAGKPALSLEGHFGLGSTAFFLGRLGQAKQHLQEGLACFAQLDSHAGASPTGHHAEVLCAGYGALTLWALGDVQAAQAEADQALELAKRAQHPYSVAFAHTMRAWLFQMAGAISPARAAAEDALDLAQRHGFPFAQAWAAPIKLWTEARDGRAAESAETLRSVLGVYRDAGYRCGETYFLGLLADCLAAAGRGPAALACLDDALRIAAETGEGYWEPELYRAKGELELSLGGNGASARRSLSHALEVAQHRGARSFEVRAALSLGRALAAEHQEREAYALLSLSRARFGDLSGHPDAAAVSALLAKLERSSYAAPVESRWP